MNALFSPKLSSNAEVRRVELLYQRLPSSIVANLIGIFLCFLVLFDSTVFEILKMWAVFMLSVSAVRVWIWYMFSKADRSSETIRGWEWMFAAGALFTGVGWGALFGPLYPPPTQPEAEMFIALMVVITAFTGSIFVALSNITFWLFIIPTLSPAIFHYAITLGTGAQWPLTAAACCTAVFIIVQRTLYLSTTRHLQRSTEAKILLAEQQAIFDSSPMGIAVLDSRRIVKCNMRLGELLGYRIQDLTNSTLDHHFVSTEEATQFIADHASAFTKSLPVQGMYRLRRADGTQFWAELSGRKMAGGTSQSVWMIADVTLRAAHERKSQPRAPA